MSDATTPPFPWSLPPRAARRQVAAALALFYGLVYGTPFLVPHAPNRVAAAMLSILLLGTLMLLAVAAFIRRDASWRASLGFAQLRVAPAVGWSLLGFTVTYAVNICLTAAYSLGHGGLEAQVANRAHWLQYLAEIPGGAILPLTAFVGLWEETVFRGFLLGRLRAALPVADTRRARCGCDAFAVAICGLCFGAGHGYQGTLGVLQTTTAGIVLGTITVWRGSLWPAIGAHLAIDAFGLLAIKVVARALGGGAGSGFSL